MLDYSQYQGPSPEWEEFVRHTNIPAGGLAPGQTAAELKRATNDLRVKLSKADLRASDLLDKVTWTDYTISTRDNDSIPARVYRPKSTRAGTLLPTYLFFHGGGHLFGSLDTEDATCCRIVAASPSPGVAVVSVDYRHTPDFKHPTQIHDAWDAFEWLAAHITSIGGDPGHVVVGGISAGACLAASVVLRAHERLQSGGSSSTTTLRIAGQVLCIPWLMHPDCNALAAAAAGAASETSSYRQNVDAPVLNMRLLTLFADLLGADDRSDDVDLNVALVPDERVRGLPKASFLVAGQDLLRDEGLFYADKLRRNRVPTQVCVFPGLPHGFRRFGELQSSRKWDERVVESIQWCLRDQSGEEAAADAGVHVIQPN